MRMSDLEDVALPLTLVFAVAFALTLQHEIKLPSPATQAIAATEAAPDYVMTITAKRLPPACRRAPQSSFCERFLAGDARIEMHESAARVAQGDYAY